VFSRPLNAIRLVPVVLSAILITGCSSQEERAHSYYERGMKLLSENESAKAAIEFRNAVKLKRDLIEGWRALANVDETNGDWQRLIADMRAIVELAPNDVPSKLKLGKLLLRAGAPQDALGLATAGLDLDFRNADLLALKAAAALKLNNSAEAVREAQNALKIDPVNADALMVMAVDRLQKGDANGALSLFQDPIVMKAKTLETNPGLQLLKIKLFEQTGNLQSAELGLKRLIESSPQEATYRRLLANFYIEQRRVDAAESELRSLVAINSTDSNTALALVHFLLSIKKDPLAARQELNSRISAGGTVFPYQMALAEMDFTEGKIEAGKQLLMSLINAGGPPEQARAATLALGQMYLHGKDFDAAEKSANEVLQQDSRNVPALRLRASVRLQHGQPDAAVADLLDALNYAPRSTELILLLATAYERSGLIELADKQFADAMRLADTDPKIGLEYAAFLQRRGSVARAEEILVSLSKRWANNAPILSALAMVKLARQDWSGAKEVADSLRQINGDAVGAADQILGAALLGRNQYDTAIAAFKSAYSAVPTAPIDSLVGALLKANRRNEAITFLKAVLAKTPENANALVLLGSVQLSSGATEEARQNFIAAVTMQPKDPRGYLALANFYIVQKNYDEAIKIVRSGEQQRPDATSLQLMMASASEQKADYESAISAYQNVLDREPSNLIATNNLASLLLDHRTDDVSLKKAKSLAAFLRKSDVPQFKDTLGWASYQQGDYRIAVSLAEEASAALPDQAAVRYHLGMSYIATGQTGKATEQLKKALELASNTTLAEQIRAALKKAGS
jgi:tetratricopeptide (TPR) repeat protein